MKVIGLFFFAMLVSFGLCACNDGDDGIDSQRVSAAVVRAFELKFPQAVDVEWEKEGRYYVADFRAPVDGLQGRVMCEMDAWYDVEANWKMTVTDVTYDMLPPVVQVGFTSGNYGSWRVEDVHIVEINGKDTLYILEVEQGNTERDLRYNAKGELVKESRDTDYRSLL